MLGTRRRLAEAIRSWQPDVIHTHLRRGARYVAQIGAGPVHFCTLHLSLNGPHYLRADGIFCISEWQLATVPATYRGRVFLLPNSLVPVPRLDAAQVRRLRAEFGADDDTFLVGGVGRLVRGKGFDVLVRAFEAAGLRWRAARDRRRRPAACPSRPSRRSARVVRRLPRRCQGPLPGIRPVREPVQDRAVRPGHRGGARRGNAGDCHRCARPARHLAALSDRDRAARRRGCARRRVAPRRDEAAREVVAGPCGVRNAEHRGTHARRV